jgi:integrase
MPVVELKGLHIVRMGAKVYIYAWRGGPRIKAALGTPQFMAAYNAAIDDHRIPDDSKFRAVVIAYRASAAFQNLAPTTKRVWGRWLDRVSAHFGDLSTAQFDRTVKIRPLIRKWRSSFAHQPRTADYAIQVLSRVLSFAVDLGRIASNPCEGFKSLYSGDRSEVIWTEDDIRQLQAVASMEVMLAVELAAATGLRTADLFRLSWSHVRADSICIATSKSRFKREALIPLYDELRALLSRIPRRSPVILTNSRGAPWRGFSSSFASALQNAKLTDRNLHFHDLRGTAATRFYIAGFSTRVIGEIMGWSEQDVEKIIRRYVGRQAAVQDAIAAMRAKSGTKAVKSTVKRPDGETAQISFKA